MGKRKECRPGSGKRHYCRCPSVNQAGESLDHCKDHLKRHPPAYRPQISRSAAATSPVVASAAGATSIGTSTLSLPSAAPRSSVSAPRHRAWSRSRRRRLPRGPARRSGRRRGPPPRPARHPRPPRLHGRPALQDPRAVRHGVEHLTNASRPKSPPACRPANRPGRSAPAW